MKKPARTPSAPRTVSAARNPSPAKRKPAASPVSPPPPAEPPSKPPTVSPVSAPPPSNAAPPAFSDCFFWHTIAPTFVSELEMQRGNLQALVSGCAERREIAEKYCGLLFAAAGVEKPTAEQAAALAAAGVDLTGNPVADILARPVSSPVWDWTKRGVSFPSAETIQAERERLLKESSALLDNWNGQEAKAAEIPEAREMVETMRRAVESAANVLMAGVETWQTEAEILQLVTLAVAKVRRLATDAEIEAARERLAAFLAPPSAEPSPPAAAEPSEPAAKRKRGPNFDFTQAQLDAAAAYRDARRKKLDRDGKPAPYLSREDCTLWRWFCNWRRKYPRNDSTLRGAKEIENARALRAALKRLPPLP